MTEFAPLLGPLKAPATPIEPVADPARACPNCGAPEERCMKNGLPWVNLNPITGQCVDCLAAMSKEIGPLETPSFDFDARSAAANDRGDA